MKKYDYIVLGAGIFGLYAAKLLTEKGCSVAVLEYEAEPFARASYINQARIHMGYHYPRSFTTAIKAAGYFDRFSREFAFAVNSSFKKVYGIARKLSLTSADQFLQFCRNADIPCEPIETGDYFQPSLVEQAFVTREYAFDARVIRDWFMERLQFSPFFTSYFGVRLQAVEALSRGYRIRTNRGDFAAPTVLNATYAGVNQILDLFGAEKYDLKYEISEIILCNVSANLKDLGLTLMDGPFFSVMPFGLQGCHSLTSVTFTHHKTSLSDLPVFPCQEQNPKCSGASLENCNLCAARPKTAWPSMHQLAKKYLSSKTELAYIKSLFSIKPILQSARVDDSRPTLISFHGQEPRLISVLSGKLNTIYDLEEVLP